jgi:hypothetical protein
VRPSNAPLAGHSRTRRFDSGSEKSYSQLILIAAEPVKGAPVGPQCAAAWQVINCLRSIYA